MTQSSWQWCLQQLHYSFLLHWCPVITSVQDLIENFLYFALQKCRRFIPDVPARTMGETACFLYVMDEMCLTGNVTFHAPVV